MFYENFERVCRERGKKPSGVCVEAGLKANRSSAWKVSEALPKQGELQKLADVLKCDVADFFRTKTAPKFHTAEDAIRYQMWRQENEDYANAKTDIEPPEPVPDANLSDDEEYVIWFMRSISRRDRHLFLDKLFAMQEDMYLAEPSEEELATVVYGTHEQS